MPPARSQRRDSHTPAQLHEGPCHWPVHKDSAEGPSLFCAHRWHPVSRRSSRGLSPTMPTFTYCTARRSEQCMCASWQARVSSITGQGLHLAQGLQELQHLLVCFLQSRPIVHQPFAGGICLKQCSACTVPSWAPPAFHQRQTGRWSCDSRYWRPSAARPRCTRPLGPTLTPEQ